MEASPFRSVPNDLGLLAAVLANITSENPMLLDDGSHGEVARNDEIGRSVWIPTDGGETSEGPRHSRVFGAFHRAGYGIQRTVRILSPAPIIMEQVDLDGSDLSSTILVSHRTGISIRPYPIQASPWRGDFVCNRRRYATVPAARESKIWKTCSISLEELPYEHVLGEWMLLRKIPSFSYHGSSCCLGILAETRSSSERTSKSSFKRDHSSWGWKRQWSSSPRETENDASIFSYLDTHCPSSLTSAAEDMKVAVENANNHSFVNQAAIAWNSVRQEWVGDRSKRYCRMQREPTRNRFSTYDDLLSTTRPFPKSIPLSEMVDFLVDIWHEEGLYD